MNLGGVEVLEVQADLFDNDAATRQTIRRMCELIAGALSDVEVRKVAFQCITDVRLDDGGSERKCIAEAVWRWLKRNLHFVTDEEQLWTRLGRRDELELLISPSVMVRARRKDGDCDDFTMMGAALLRALNVPAVIKTFKCDRQEPWRWAHVCCCAVLEDGSIFPCDASHGDYPGWQVPAQDIYGSALWDADGNEVNESKGACMGLGAYTPDPNWTGNEMTTFQGPHAGPYPSLDVMRAWYPRARRAGLSGIKRSKFRGVGQTDFTDLIPTGDGTGSDVSGTITTQPYVQDPIISQYYSTPLTNADLQDLASANTSSESGSSFNLSSFLNSLVGAGSTLGRQALATPGTTILPNGTVVTGTPAGTSALTTGTGISGSFLILLLVGLGVVLVVSKK